MEITAKAQEILKIIEAAGGEWVNRRQLAESLGKNKLTQWNLKLLDDLIAAGLIEAQQHEKPRRASAVGYEHVYRIKTEEPLYIAYTHLNLQESVQIAQVSSKAFNEVRDAPYRNLYRKLLHQDNPAAEIVVVTTMPLADQDEQRILGEVAEWLKAVRPE